MINGTKKVKIVSSFYELESETERGGFIYKSFPLLTLTIREIIYDDFDYVFYTDKKTYLKYENDIRSWTDNKPNVKIKFCELNSDLYKNILNPIRIKKFQEGEIWERFYCIKNYEEVIINKFKFLLQETSEDYNTIWIDAGLFGTSCNDGWRDYMVEIAHTKNFIDKINEKINEYGFICLRGKDVTVNIDLRSRLFQHFNVDVKIVAGALFGGSHDNIISILSNYEKTLIDYVVKYQELISEQELLGAITHDNDNVKFYDFGDWVDLQKSLLNLMDVFQEEKYIKDSCELYSTKYLDRYKRNI